MLHAEEHPKHDRHMHERHQRLEKHANTRVRHGGLASLSPAALFARTWWELN
jgi:hypothetical protein